ncbi:MULTISPECIES: LysR family transcriptional regulator [Rhizobium/Agrobacterium group]|jgi:DNA-binding transcriptional LysR family regulator|uniref:LysR family transcriptional regulator n=1 Tax=Bradyrhizobium lupini HPC(L) TaxID=1229491 RepID=A0ABN0HHZ2_RHILU|nr:MULTISPECIES: LysR family transcriptional regulator [Rhizobium/Agrobacterium group]AUC10966.1 LysR family transcriptional regulator [Rhizobium sp. Y9]EKJ94186.1 LysR family transcriptional regulator [Bradyrhizobium lupini HPC(L)]KIV62019.1 Transcriptional regulator, LysR family [Rhizobium sp. UR51a]MBM7328795.1 LysR family transcriptional regulator [Agrobacterium sp. S2]MDP9731940.1 DNA-binding transcriptional LysR family regulator [Rhizobium sp. SORGH_AS_0285]MDP9756223.1 DNA-binding tran
MNWDDVRLFLSVARSGQFLSAARKLGVNHATLSRRVSALEAAIGTQLFLRSTNGCELTEEGQRLLASAERMETEMLNAQANLGRVDTAVAGTVRIGAPDGLGVSFLAPRLGRLTARYPDLKIQLVPVPRSFSLSQREADIAITIERPEQGRLMFSKLTDYSLGLYASANYLADYGTPDDVEALKRHRRIGYVEDLIFSPSLNFTGEIMRDWDAAFEISSATGQTEAVRSGAGIGILHNYIAGQYPELIRIIPHLTISRSYWTAYHESARQLVRVRTVVNFLQELVAEERRIFT